MSRLIVLAVFTAVIQSKKTKGTITKPAVIVANVTTDDSTAV